MWRAPRSLLPTGRPGSWARPSSSVSACRSRARARSPLGGGLGDHGGRDDRCLGRTSRAWANPTRSPCSRRRGSPAATRCSSACRGTVAPRPAMEALSSRRASAEWSVSRAPCTGGRTWSCSTNRTAIATATARQPCTRHWNGQSLSAPRSFGSCTGQSSCRSATRCRCCANGRSRCAEARCYAFAWHAGRRHDPGRRENLLAVHHPAPAGEFRPRLPRARSAGSGG